MRRHMIVVAEYGCINLALLSLQELLSPSAQMTELPVLRWLHNREETKSVWFDIWTKDGSKKKQSL